MRNNGDSLGENVHNGGLCSWVDGRKAVLRPETSQRTAPYLKLIHFLNRNRLVYFAHEGTALGAFRHGGIIPGDGDLDVIYPVYLNDVPPDYDYESREFRSADFISSSALPDKTLELCGRTRGQWVSFVLCKLQHLARCQGEEFVFHKADYGGIRVRGFGGMSADVVVSVYDQSFVDSCIGRAPFYDTYVLALDNTPLVLEQLYGTDYMKPEVKMCSTWKIRLQERALEWAGRRVGRPLHGLSRWEVVCEFMDAAGECGIRAIREHRS